MEKTAILTGLESVKENPGLGRRLADIENILLSLILAAMVLLPITEVVLRFFFLGIEAVSSLIQHLTLAVASMGAAVAAREDRLLTFSAIQFMEGNTATLAKLVSNAFAAGICALFCISSVQFVQFEKEGGAILAYGIPTWVFELVQPLGFALIAWRLLLHASSNLRGRFVASVIAASIAAIILFSPIDPAQLVTPALVCLLVATLLGAPIFVAVGGAALILLWGEYVPLASLAVDHYGIATNPSLPAIPMFTLAGYFLAESGAPGRLLAVFIALFGRLRGGAAIVTILGATFFTCFTGASGVTILALGGLALPILLNSGIKEKSALGLITGGGSAGVLLMPALPLVLYAIVAEVDMEAMFLAGLLPALLMMALVVGWGIMIQPAVKRKAIDWTEVKQALWAAKWELAIPLVPIGVLFSGFATPVEAAAMTALYSDHDHPQGSRSDRGCPACFCQVRADRWRHIADTRRGARPDQLHGRRPDDGQTDRPDYVINRTALGVFTGA